MENKLEVGMFVRTNDGYINKIKNVNQYNVLVDGRDLFGEELNIPNNEIVKASYNIIDLIEVGDYVDGEQVRYIEEGTDYRVLAIDEDYTYIIAGYDCDGFTKPIKSIVTKEQFSSMEYRLGDDK